MNTSRHWSGSLWLDGEPSFAWKETQEDVLSVYFDSKTGTWVWNDSPNAGYSGTKYGYIVEFEGSV